MKHVNKFYCASSLFGHFFKRTPQLYKPLTMLSHTPTQFLLQSSYL